MEALKILIKTATEKDVIVELNIAQYDLIIKKSRREIEAVRIRLNREPNISYKSAIVLKYICEIALLRNDMYSRALTPMPSIIEQSHETRKTLFDIATTL